MYIQRWVLKTHVCSDDFGGQAGKLVEFNLASHIQFGLVLPQNGKIEIT
jgi:hypothetical protein